MEEQLIKTRVLFISHIHADHNLGILNLVSERNRLLRKKNIDSKLFLVMPFNVYNWYISYNHTIEDLSPGCQVLFTQFLEEHLAHHQPSV